MTHILTAKEYIDLPTTIAKKAKDISIVFYDYLLINKPVKDIIISILDLDFFIKIAIENNVIIGEIYFNGIDQWMLPDDCPLYIMNLVDQFNKVIGYKEHEFKPREIIKNRYATKKVNPNYYYTIKADKWKH